MYEMTSMKASGGVSSGKRGQQKLRPNIKQGTASTSLPTQAHVSLPGHGQAIQMPFAAAYACCVTAVRVHKHRTVRTGCRNRATSHRSKRASQLDHLWLHETSERYDRYCYFALESQWCARAAVALHVSQRLSKHEPAQLVGLDTVKTAAETA